MVNGILIYKKNKCINKSYNIFAVVKLNSDWVLMPAADLLVWCGSLLLHLSRKHFLVGSFCTQSFCIWIQLYPLPSYALHFAIT